MAGVEPAITRLPLYTEGSSVPDSGMNTCNPLGQRVCQFRHIYH